ncbi:MAG TPA: antitoxin Xre-like helix-turn-helix domain-containing protein [Trueperaceae bacterium]|nr:antitoxin Xre-like helix-turn-helix domain-containing protein [Trueperaceae bacterium]
MADSLLHASATDTIAAIKAGLPYPVFETLAEELRIPANDLARTISVPLRTLQRRKHEGVFQVDESDRLFRILRLTERAQEVLGPSGTTWLTSPKRFLGGETPLTFSDTEAGAWEVMQALGRLEHGVFL